MAFRIPTVLEIPYNDPIEEFSKLSHFPWAVFLDSAKQSDIFGQFSYIAIDPFLKISSKDGNVTINEKTTVSNPFLILKEILERYKMEKVSDIPPFQGGLLGFFSYDLCHHLENLSHNQDDMNYPDMMIGIYDLIIAFDLPTKRSWIISNGFSVAHSNVDKTYAKKRLLWLKDQLNTAPRLPNIHSEGIDPINISSNFDADSYKKAIQKTIDYIYNGDIFQANIAQRFSCKMPTDMTSFQLYSRLRKINPAPFAAYLNYGDLLIASASPERFLKLTSNQVETRPIKGTRPRGKSIAEDRKLAEELRFSEKDKAENTMIVDLLRNDLSKVCKDHSVNVTQLCELETYASVHHLVSVVTGELQADKSAIDLLMAAFPGGSITGAPKVRAMEIISEIEPTKRGPYCGSIGFVGFNGEMDTSIIIRSYVISNDTITFQAGGGIVADSDPSCEYEESLTKARYLIHALTSNKRSEV